MFGFLKEKLKSTISKISEKFSSDKDKEKIEEKKEKIVEKEPVEEFLKSKEKEKKAFHELESKKKEEIASVKAKKQAVDEKQKQKTETKKSEEITKTKKDEKQPIESRKADEIKIDKLPDEIAVKKETQKPSVELTKEEKIIEEKKEEKPSEKGFFERIKEKITTTKISESDFEDMFYELEIDLLENNVALEVVEKIKKDLKERLVNKPISRNDVEEIVKKSLLQSIKEIINIKEIRFFDLVKTKKPFVVCFFGINGSGKTTTIAKLAYLLKNRKYSVVLAAADTFRAASIEQLQLHADKLGIKCIKHDYGSDPAAVAFDAIRHAESKNIDVVLIDTAGRMHSNTNLIDEMKKIVRVAKPDLKIFVGESITGNDCVEQAQTFDSAISIDGIILTKADVDEKGGAALSISYVTKKPILFLGMGQEYADLKEFEPSIILDNLGLDN